MNKLRLMRIALEVDDKEMQEWAEEEGVTPRAVYRCIDGTMTSERLAKRIDEYIEEQLGRLGVITGAELKNDEQAA